MSQNFLKDFLKNFLKNFLNIQGRPSMKLWSVYLTCIGILVLTTGGCAQSEGESRDLLNIQLFNILGKGLPETFPPAQSMRVIAVTLPEGDAKPAHILLESLWPITTTGQQILESLPEDQPMMLLFEGLDGGNQPLFSGGVGPIEIQSTTGKISEHLIFLSEIGSINPAMTLAEDNTWTAVTFEDATLRAGHTAVTLADGRALIIGGGAIDPQGRPLSASDSIIVYEPNTGRFSVATDAVNIPLRLSAPRIFHSATVFADGRILIAGGYSLVNGKIQTLRSAEWLEPRLTGGFTRIDAPAMAEGRAKHAAILRADQALLVVGGEQGDNIDGVRALHSAEIFEPSAGTFTLTAQMNAARSAPAAVLMPNGEDILVIGGSDGLQPLASMDLFKLNDALKPEFQHWGDLLYARASLGAVRFDASGGRYLAVVGGRGEGGAVGEAEVWDVVAGKRVVTAPLNIPRSDFALAHVGDGLSAAIIGGLDTANQPTNTVEWLHIDAAKGAFSIRLLGSRLSQPRAYLAATRLPNGLILATAGQSADATPSATSDILNTGLPSPWFSAPPDP